MAYYSGQGRVLVGTRDSNGDPGVFRYVGNVPELEINVETDVEEHKESTSGQRMTDLQLITGKSSKASFTIEEFDADNLALALYGAKSSITGSTVTAEALPTGLVAGDIVRLEQSKASSIVVKDSAGTPATLTANTHYEVFSADHGSLKFLDVAGFTQPFKVDYAHATVTNVNMLTQGFIERWLRFEGLNSADSNKPVLIEIYRFQFSPAKTLALISDKLQSFQLEGAGLYDASKQNDAVLGQFGRVVLI